MRYSAVFGYKVRCVVLVIQRVGVGREMVGQMQKLNVVSCVESMLISWQDVLVLDWKHLKLDSTGGEHYSGLLA